MLSEVGITNFLSQQEAVKNCRIKQEVDDFVVQEVVNGSVCEITPLLDYEKYKLSEDIFDNLPKDLSKAERKNIYEIANHNIFKRLVTQNGQFTIKIDNSEDLFVFTIIKYNYSSNSLVNLLSKRLNVPHNYIQMGGTKDKRAITFQEISVKCSIEALMSYAVALDRNERLKLQEFGYTPEIDMQNQKILDEVQKYIKILPVDAPEEIKICNVRRGSAKRLGDLDGNKFTIMIRGLLEVKEPPEFFINYFGQQRFGVNLNNHVIGEKMLNKRYGEAVDLILEGHVPSNDSAPDNGSKNLSQVQRYILKMKERGNHDKFIVNSLSRSTKMIYLHAFQSYKFNLQINERLEGKSVGSKDKVCSNGVLIDAPADSKIEEIYVPLEKMDDKLLKGGYRKIIEVFHDFSYEKLENGTKVVFFLKKSCYATMALRELIQECACEDLSNLGF